MARSARVQAVVQVLQLRSVKAPVVQHLLQAAGDAGSVVGHAQVARDQYELAVAGAVLQGGKFHGVVFVKEKGGAPLPGHRVTDGAF